MYLSGTIQDFKGVLMAAADLAAEAIHFIAPNIVFILARNKEDYVHLATNIYVGESVMIPKASYKNMDLYIKAAKHGFNKPDSPFYMEVITSALFLDGKILFNESNRLEIEVEIPSFLLKKDVEFKMEESVKSSYDLNNPYLRINYPNFRELNRQMKKYKKRYADKIKKSSDNTIRIEEEQLVLYHRHDEYDCRFETGITEFAINRKHQQATYSFSDRAFYLMYWFARIIPTEEVIFIPRNGYCLIEGHMSNMVAKVRTMLKNDL